MPYPMIRHPTFREVKSRLEQEFDCVVRKVGKCLDDDRTMWRIERSKNGSKFPEYFLVIEDLDDRMTRTRLLSICRRFEIPADYFDLSLD